MNRSLPYLASIADVHNESVKRYLRLRYDGVALFGELGYEACRGGELNYREHEQKEL